MLNDRFAERTADAFAVEPGTHEQAPHLTRSRVAAGGDFVECCEQQLTARRDVFSRQRLELLVERVGIETGIDQMRVLQVPILVQGDERLHQGADIVQLFAGSRNLDDCS